MVIRQSLARAWRTDLPRVVLLSKVGNAFNWLGYGLILPFEIKPLAATESKAPPGDPMPEAA